MTMQLPVGFPFMVIILNGTLTAPAPINLSANFSGAIRQDPTPSGSRYTVEIKQEVLDELLTLQAERLMPPIRALVSMAAVSAPPQAWFDEELDD